MNSKNLKNKPYIIKGSGEREQFSSVKLSRSLKDAGASLELTSEIVDHVEKDIKDGMSTDDIFRHAFTLLRKHRRPIAARYSLKKAIMRLGPSGFPFEKFVAELLKMQGYKTKVGVYVQGVCVRHEIDVIAERNKERLLVECKFHNASGIKSDLKVAMYTHARFVDVSKRNNKKSKNVFERTWLITNTNFTSQAIKFGRCVGLHMTGWNYPHKKTLQHLIEEARLHPVTCLTTLSSAEKNRLLEEGAVLCRHIIKKPDVLYRAGLRKRKIEKVLEESGELCRMDEDLLKSENTISAD